MQEMSKKTSTARRRVKKKEPESDSGVLFIDENRLEKEWGNQALLFHNYAEQCAVARHVMDQAKAELDVTDAELDTLIRADPGSYGIEKTSESAIKNAILQQPGHQTALEGYNDAVHAVRMLEAMVRAMEHRKTALKSMVELRLANYYAEPTLNRSQQTAYDEMSKTEVRSRGRAKRPTPQD